MRCKHCGSLITSARGAFFEGTCDSCLERVDRAIAENLGWEPDPGGVYRVDGLIYISGRKRRD